MSWYNDDPENNFIDATQEHTGGGGVITAVSEVTNAEDLVITETTPDAEEETTIGNVLLPAVFNEQDGTFDLYIRNVNQGGRIFLTTRGDGEQVKIDDGKLYVYYYYNPAISLVIPSGWTNVANYLVANRQGINNNSAALVAAGVAIADLEAKTASLGLTTLTLGEVQASINGRVTILEARQLEDPRATSMILAARNERQLIARAETNLYNAFLSASFVPRNAASIMRIAKIKRNVILGVLTSIAFGGTLTAVIGLIEYIIDLIAKSSEEDVLNNLISSRVAIDGQSDKNDVDKIYISGLQIASATNAGMTDGTYEIELDEELELAIEIKVTNGIAEITDLIGTTTDYVVGDIINIDKTELGGTSGTLDINVNQLYSMVEILDFEILKSQNNLKNIDGRQRRRQFIPDKNSFSDGIDVTETNVTEPSGEITKELDISLKVDTAQFQYDGSGNLQIKSSVLTPPTDPAQFTTDIATGNLQIIDYDKIAEIGDDTAGAETGLYQYVLNKINDALGNEETYDANGNVVVPATNIYQNINNIYELVMVGDQTFQNNNDYKLNLGYKTIWSGYAYDLITIALKAVRAGIFDSSFYNNDWLGYFPSLTRISDDEYMSVVRDANVEILNNLTFKKGLVYFKQDDPLVDYNLNRKFEFVCFIRPQDVDNAGVEYTLLQTGIRLPSKEYELDTSKLKLGFRDNKFEITHNVRRIVEYYETLTTKNYYNPGAVTDTLVQDATTGTTSVSKYVPTNFNLHMLWGIFSQQTYQNVLPWANLETLLKRDDTYTHFSNSVFQLYDWNFNTLRDMANPATDVWASPKIVFHEYQDINLPRRGIGKMVIKYEYRYAQSQGNIMGTKTFTSLADLDANLEFRLRVNIKKYNDPTNTIYGSRIYDFTEWQYDPVSLNPPAGSVSFYTKTLWMPHINYPLLQTDQYNYYELELVHRGGATFAPLPVGSQSYNFYANQHSLRIYSINYFEYDVTPTTFADHSPVTFQDTADFLPTPIDANKWHKVVAELDLPNKVVQYWVDGVNNYFTFDTINNIPHSSLQLPQSDPTIPYFYSADFEFTNQGYTGLVLDNDIIVIGNEPSQGELQYTHFAWKHFQDPLEYYMTQEERDKLDFLITYNYYYETIKVDRYLKVKEFYADVLDARKILVNGGFAFNELTSGDQITLIRSDFQSSDNVATTNAFVNIDRLYVSDPVASGNGFLSYDATTKIFSIGSSTISSADVENAVGNLIKVTPSTYGLIYNQTDPLDKFIQIDDNYVNNLVNLVIQNELVLTNAFTDATYGDVLIQVKDASAYSPYDLRELDDTNVRYNYKINGNHQYLYRELNQEIQYDPLLGVAYGELYPVVMYHFQGEIINNARDWLVGIPASDYDFEMLSQGGQVVYGSGPLNMKGWNGIEGGNTIIRTKNAMEIATQAHRSCISFFHKPFGSNIDGTDDHKIVEFLDEYNYPVFYVKLEYVSNTAVYKLVFVNPANINDETAYTFNNSENEIYFGNENCILIWCDMPYWHMYINGKYHGVAMDHTYDYGTGNIDDCKIQIDLNNFNSRSLLYELKVYQNLLFKTNSSGVLSSTDLTFNNKVVVDVTEMIRIATFVSGGFIIKELSGVQETKARSIETKTRSLDTQRRVSSVETKLPATGTGTKGFVYSDGVNDAYNLENPTDLTAMGAKGLKLNQRELITFNHTDTGSGTFQIQVKGRSNTSVSDSYKLAPDYSHPQALQLTKLDEPYDPFIYTFVDTDFIAGQELKQDQAFGKGLPQNGYGFSITFYWYIISGDIFKYTGTDGVWGIYYVDYEAINPVGATFNATPSSMADFNLIQMFNNNDEYIFDYYKFQRPYYDLYVIYNNDFDKKIKILLEPPELYIAELKTGSEIELTGIQYFASGIEPIKLKFFVSQFSKQNYNQYFIDDRPLFLPVGQNKVITIDNGRPDDPDNYYKYSWFINYSPIAHLWESGDLLLNGDVYVNAPIDTSQGGGSYLGLGTLVNSVDNIKNSDNTIITGLPAKIDQVFNFEVTSVSVSGNTMNWTGSDRVNTYNNQAVTQFEFYYGDTIRITFSPAFEQEYINNGNYILFNFSASSGGFNYHQANLNGDPLVAYVHLVKTLNTSYYIEWLNFNNANITFNLQNIKDYHNPAFLSTDEYILKYKPHSDTYFWENNSGLGVATTSTLETSIPLGSFKAKTATTQTSSRKTLSSAVPIEKVSQITKYQVFNTEVEVNGNLLLEEVNADVASLFTIYTSEDKKDPVSGVDNFKDKASITLVDATKEWVFKREPESEDLLIATTKFIHDTTTLLTLKHNQVECGVELKVGTIRFADNTTLTTSADLTGLLNDISTTNPSYTEFAKNIKLPNGDIISSVYDDTDVRSVLSTSAGTGLVWNVGTNQFDNSITQYADADVRSVLSSSAGTGLVWNSGTNQFDNSITQYTDTNVRSVLSSSAGTGLVWNATNNQFDNSITQYADADVRSVLSSSAGTGLVWNATNNQFDNSITQYADADVRSVLSGSAGTGLVWNAGTNQFDNSITQYADADVISVLSSSAGTGLVWNAGTNQFDNSITQYADADVRSVLSTSAGTGLVWNAGTNQFDNSITQYTDTNVRSVLSTSAGTGLSWNATNNQFDNSITQYTDADVDNVLSTSAGTGLVWNSGTNQFDNSITQYTDALARTACFPLTQANTGLPGTSAINLFANTLWYNSVDGYNRLYFVSSAGTFIRAPNLTNSVVMTEIGTTSILKCDISGVLSYKDLRIGNGNNTIPSLYLDGANGTTLSSRIIFADSGISIYKYGMAIYYDSYNNKLKISGDDNNDNTLETPPALTIVRSNRYVGILNETPLEPLDVNGNIVASGTIKSTTGFTFPDNTTQTTAPFQPTFFKIKLDTNKTIGFPSPGQIVDLFGSGTIEINTGSYNVITTTGAQGVRVGVAGLYEISYNIRTFNGTTTGTNGNNARCQIQTSIYINSANINEITDGSYMRYASGANNRYSANTYNTLLNLNANDVIQIHCMRTGQWGNVAVRTGSQMCIKRVA